MSARPIWRVLAEPLAVLAVVGAIGAALRDPPEPPRLPDPPPVPSPVPTEEPADIPDPPPPPPAPTLDTAAVAQAEAVLAAAAQARAEAEQKADEAALRRKEAEAGEALEEQTVRGAEMSLSEAADRLKELRQRGAALLAETEQVRSDLTSLADAPRPRRKPLIDKTPVARPTEGEEFHFEVRRQRVTFIDMDRLVDRVKADAQVQIRLAAGNPSGLSRPISSSVGPVGAFALRYELGRSLPSSMRDLLDAKGVTFTVLGYEIVPVRELRGEPLERITQPASDFQRVLNSLNPSHVTVTLWVYPDSFAVYRRLNEYLHQRGFLVAARPLPAGMPIRGSPSGSISAGQ